MPPVDKGLLLCCMLGYRKLLRSVIRPINPYVWNFSKTNTKSTAILYFIFQVAACFFLSFFSFFVHCNILSMDLWTMQGNVHTIADLCSRIVETKRNKSRNGTKPQRCTLDSRSMTFHPMDACGVSGQVPKEKLQ